MIRQNKFVKVKFLSEWMGNPEGSLLSIIEVKANELKGRGTVEFVGDFVGFREEVKTKSIDEPPNNKMISAAPVDKSAKAVKKARRPKKIK